MDGWSQGMKWREGGSKSGGQALRLAWTQKIDATTGGRCDYWRRVMVKRRTRIL